MPHRSWNASMKFSKKKMKKADATTQHWFSYAYTKFFKEEEKSWKGWRNNATLIFIHLDSTTKKAEFPSFTKVLSHATTHYSHLEFPGNSATGIFKHVNLILKSSNPKNNWLIPLSIYCFATAQRESLITLGWFWFW